LLGVVAAFLVAFPVLAFDPGDTKPLPPNVLKIKDLGQKTYAKEGLLHLEKVHQKIQVPEVIWSSDENVFEKDKEVARKRTQAILEADTVHPELRRIHKIMKPRIYKLNDRVYELYGFEMTMTTIVVGDTGLIIVDTNYGNEIGEMVFSIWREATGNQMPVHTVIYTHHHPDQCSGTAAYVDPDDVDAGKVNIIAHEDFFTNFIRESGYASPIMGHRALWAFGPLLPVGPEGYVSQGIGFVLPHLWVNRTSYTAKPTITIADHRTLEIDGVIMEFMHVPGESADHIAMYMPETETLLVGDSIQGETVPNMYTIRGAPYRDGEEWRRSIDRMRTYHAKDFTNHHGRPVTGREYVESVLLTWRDAIQYMNDQALRHINAGYTRDEVAERVVLPETLANHEYLRPLRGSADQNVRNIYNGYLGWYMGDPTERARPDFGRRAELYVEQMGGRDKILRSAQKALNDKDYGWTMDLTTWLIRHDPKDQEARNLKAKAMRQWGFQQPEPGWRNWALTGAWELENGSIPMKETLALSVDTMDEMPLLDLFKILRVGLNSEDIKTETHLIGLEIDGEAFIFGVRNGNLISDRGAPTWDTSMAKMTRPEFYDVFFFNSANGTRIDNDVVEKVVARLESPFGNKVPVVPR
jgi:alkyl sulfatase BDS1-like metallo-beta-lactamase superfamily hydrolase